MKLAMSVAFLAAIMPLATKAEGFWVGNALCDWGDCDETWCSSEIEQFQFLSDNEPSCGEFYGAQTDDDCDWNGGERPDKFTEILCGRTIDFYNTGSGYNFYFSGGDGTQLGSCYYDTGYLQGGCPFGGGSCAVQGVMYCNSYVQIC